MAQASRDISQSEALHRLNELYNILGLVGHITSPRDASHYQEAVLHCIAALHAIAEGDEPPPSYQRDTTVLEFRRRSR